MGLFKRNCKHRRLCDKKLGRTDMDVSVIVPLYQGKKYVRKIISMIERNKIVCCYVMECAMELIFVNDYPEELINEGTMCCSSVLDGISIVQNDINQGIHRSRITGVKHAKGDYFLFLDQDDQISDAYILSQLRGIKGNDAILCNGVYRNNKLIYADECQQKRATDKNCYLEQKDVIISPGQVLIRKQSIPKQWYENILKENGSDDVLLWILMLQNACSFAINTLVLYLHNEDGGNASFNFVNMRKSVLEIQSVLDNGKLLCGKELETCKMALGSRVKKYDQYIKVLSVWEQVLCNIEHDCKKNVYNRIAIYGRGVVGEKLCEDLARRGINISYFIDKDAKAYICSDIETVELESFTQIVDIVIITAMFDQNKILNNFCGKSNVLMVKSLRDYCDNT